MAGSSGIRAGKAYVEVGLRSKIAQGAKQVESRLRGMADRVARIGRAVAAVGVIAAVALAPVLKTYATFEDQMARVSAITRATTDDFNALRRAAKELGATTSFSATEVGQAEQFLGMAGFNAQDAIKGLPTALNLAKADPEVGLGGAADIASDVLSAFRLLPDQFSRVGDVLAATATSANTSVGLMGETFQQAAPAAAAAGQSIEEMATAAGLLGNSGIKASAAGTDLKNLLVVMAKNATIAGVATRDAAGGMRPLLDVMRDLGVATADMSDGEKLAFMIDTFGKISGKSAIVLSAAGDSIDSLRTRINGSAGAAAEMARVIDDTLLGSFRSLMSAGEGLQITLGETLGPAVRKLVDQLTVGVRAVNDFAAAHPELVTQLGMAAASAAIAGGAMVAIGGTLSVLAFSARGLVPLATPFSLLARSAGIGRTVVGALGSALLGTGGKLKTASKASQTAFSVFSARTLTINSRLKAITFAIGGQLAQLGRLKSVFGGVSSVAVGGTRLMASGWKRGVSLLWAMDGVTGRLGLRLRLMRGAIMSALAPMSQFASMARLNYAMGGVTAVRRQFARVVTPIMRSTWAMIGLRGAVTSLPGKVMAGVKSLWAMSAAARAVSMAKIGNGLIGLLSGSVSAVLPVVSAGLAGLVSPAGLATIAIAGAGYAIWQMAGGAEGLGSSIGSALNAGRQHFNALKQSAGKAWSGISSVADESLGEIVSRVQSGDLEGAWALTTAALSAGWAEVTAAFAPQLSAATDIMNDVWSATTSTLSSLWSGFGDMFPGITGYIANQWSALTDLIDQNDGTESLFSSWENFSFGMSEMMIDAVDGMFDYFDIFIGWLKKSWNSSIAFIEKAWVRLKGLFSDDVNVDAEITRINKDRDASNADVNKERDEKIEERAQARLDTLETLNEDKQRAKDAAEQRAADVQAEFEAKRQAAREALTQEVNTTPEQRAEAKTEATKIETTARLDEEIAKAQAELRAVGKGLGRIGKEAYASGSKVTDSTTDSQSGLTFRQLQDRQKELRAKLDADTAKRDGLNSTDSDAALQKQLTEARERQAKVKAGLDRIGFGSLQSGKAATDDTVDVESGESRATLKASGESLAAQIEDLQNRLARSAALSGEGTGLLPDVATTLTQQTGLVIDKAETSSSGTFSARAAVSSGDTIATRQIALTEKAVSLQEQQLKATEQTNAKLDELGVED